MPLRHARHVVATDHADLVFDTGHIRKTSRVALTIAPVLGRLIAVEHMEPWWQRFFRGPWLQAQQAFFTEEQSREHADTVERLLGCKPGERILDVPCGDGRIAVQLASRGLDVVGVDLSEALIERGRQRTSKTSNPVDWHLGDMRELPFKGGVDAAFCWWSSFGYFDETGNRAFVQAVERALVRGGRFVIDTPLMETFLEEFQSRNWLRVGDVHMLEDRRYDHETGRMEVDWTFLAEAHTATRTHMSIRLYTYRELSALLRDTGFERVEGFDPTSLAPFKLGSPRCAMVAWKPR